MYCKQAFVTTKVSFGWRRFLLCLLFGMSLSEAHCTNSTIITGTVLLTMFPSIIMGRPPITNHK